MTNEELANLLLERMDFLITCEYADFHPEFKRGVQEAIEIVKSTTLGGSNYG